MPVKTRARSALYLSLAARKAAGWSRQCRSGLRWCEVSARTYVSLTLCGHSTTHGSHR
jgi:hypothetical protein